jgi:hypothetical protein
MNPQEANAKKACHSERKEESTLRTEGTLECGGLTPPWEYREAATCAPRPSYRLESF